MKKILVVLLMMAAMAVYAASPTGGWNYIYHVGTQTCHPAQTMITAGQLIIQGCRVANMHQYYGNVLVLDCRNHPDVGGFVWYGKTLGACEWIKENINR